MHHQNKQNILRSIRTKQSNKPSFLVGIIILIIAVFVINTIGSQTKSICATLLLLLAIGLCTCRLMVIFRSMAMIITMVVMIAMVTIIATIARMILRVVTAVIATITATSASEVRITSAPVGARVVRVGIKRWTLSPMGESLRRKR